MAQRPDLQPTEEEIIALQAADIFEELMKKFYQTLNQAPRSPHGPNRKPNPPVHSSPSDGANPSAGGTEEGTIVPAATDPYAGKTTYKRARPGVVQWATPQDPQDFDLSPGALNYMTIDWAKAYHQLYASPNSIPLRHIPSAGIRQGEIIGWRLWWVLDCRLYSLVHPEVWYPNVTKSGDLDEIVHSSGTRGGVYSFNNRLRAEAEAREEVREFQRLCTCNVGFFAYQHPRPMLALGSVKLWGEVVEHGQGYRAEHAKVHTIDVVVDLQIQAYSLIVAEEVRHIYGVGP